MIEVNIEADVERATQNLKLVERVVIPAALSGAINKTMQNTVTAANRHLRDETGLKIKELKDVQINIRSSRTTLRAIMRNRWRPYNLRRFVTPSKLKVGAFVNKTGVVASPWRKRQVFEGAFIMRGKTHGKLIVVKRSGLTRSGIKGMYGPNAAKELNRPPAKALIKKTIRTRFPINFERELTFQLKRMKR